MNRTDSLPWHRQLWPWLLMVPPAGAVIGGLVTLYLAVTRPDPLVRPDCVRDGVTIVCGAGAEATAETNYRPPR